ncbi:MAG TPA: hypothetical protein VFX92_08255, partial [Candidatus Krumholzibacteria bacterium]|nr:hypothetical protein [Candidatus Krumholzibacteria bacterium]
MFPLTRARAGAPAGVYITNNATAGFVSPLGPDSVSSNRTATLVQPVYGLRLTPPGTVAAPAFRFISSPGDTVVCRFTLENLANDADSFVVDTALL